MIQLSDYYRIFKPSIANSNQIGLNEDEMSYKLGGVYIGEFESVTGNKLPALIPLDEINGLCFLSNKDNKTLVNETIQSLVLRIVASMPMGSCLFTLYDGLGDGSGLISLSGLTTEAPEGMIITDPEVFRKELRKEQNHIPEVIQKVLGYKYSGKTLMDYNSVSGNKMVPYHFIVITDFPQTLNKDHCDAIEEILRKGHRAGVFVIMGMDTDFVETNSYNKCEPLRMLDYTTTIYSTNGRYYIKNIPNEELFRRFKLTLDISLLEKTDETLDFIRDKVDVSVKSVNLQNYLPPKERWWNRVSVPELKIPFGITPNMEVVNLAITQTSGKNVAVVVGIPGSGKSVFLNAIITSTAFYYSPDEVEMYLIDFSGVEFSVYADMELPHAKVIAPESEREFGISVLRRIKEEGNRRADLFRQAGVNNIEEYRSKDGGEHMPRIVVIIDEFQKFFEDDLDKTSQEAEKIILIIVQEYRKFGINLILATQSISKYANRINLGMIANRVAFEWNDMDSPSLFLGPPPSNLINGPGDCVYNCRSGKPSDNVPAKGFYVSQGQLRPLLGELRSYANDMGKFVANPIIFRADGLVYISENKDLNNIQKADIPSQVKVFLGEPIEISESHAYIEISRGTNANILVIGGQNGNAAQRIAINCVRSIYSQYNDRKATFAFFNFIHEDNSLYNAPQKLYNDIPFDVSFVEQDKQLQYLEKIKEEIERRQTDELVKKRHVFLTFLSFQSAYAYRKTGDWGGELTDYGRALQFILEQGPLVGIFSIIQVDELESLNKTLDKPLSLFNHRVVLQMSEDDSRSITDSPVASRIYVENKPSSINRAYYYNKNNNTIIKFKPYEI